MRTLIQRVRDASVTIEGELFSQIEAGLLIFLGIEEIDDESDSAWLSRKIASLRLFPDEEGKMNHSIIETGGELLVVSQFTLHGRVKKGTRPSFERAARPEVAEPLYAQFVETLAAEANRPIATGQFGAMMDVQLTNWGPVTLWIDSRNRE